MPFSPFDPDRAEARRRRFRAIPVRTLVPNVITLLALCAGLTAIRLSVEGKLEWALGAIVFAAIYSAVLIAVAVGRMLLPPEALYVIAGLSGMSDMDAITLSTARLVHAGRLDQAIAWRLIVVAAMSNLFFKGLNTATGISGFFNEARTYGLEAMVKF